MKKLILLGLLASCSAFAQPAKPVETMTPEKFAIHKAITLEAIDKRDKIIDQEKACVTKAQEINALKDCFNDARQNRKEMGKELRDKMGKTQKP